MNLNVFNITDDRAIFKRTVYDGLRDSAPVLFTGHRDLSVRPIFRLLIKGTF